MIKSKNRTLMTQIGQIIADLISGDQLYQRYLRSIIPSSDEDTSESDKFL